LTILVSSHTLDSGLLNGAQFERRKNGRREGTFSAMQQWNRSETLGLAKASCSMCRGYGQRPTRTQAACKCVFRAIFRACYGRFRYCASEARYISRVSLEKCGGGKDRRNMYARKNEDYIADFCLVSKRTLDEFEYKIFRFHFLLGADWKLCCRQLKIDRGTFFHAVYRIQEKLGKTFRELQPYGLYPLDEYFGGTARSERPAEAAPKPKVVTMRLKVPVRSLPVPIGEAA